MARLEGSGSGPDVAIPAAAMAPADVLDTTAAGPLVIRGGLLRTAAYVAGTALSVLSSALLTRHLGAGGFGRYITVISLITIVGSVTEAGMTNLGVREYTTLHGTARDRLMRDLLGLRLALTLTGVLGATAFAVVAGYADVLVIGTALAGFGLVLTTIQATYTIPLLVEILAGRVSALDLARQTATVAAIVALVIAGADVLPFLAVSVPVGLAVLAATVLIVRRRMPLRPGFNVAGWGRLLRVTAPFALASAVGAVYIYFAVVTMSLVSSAQQTGYFGAAFRVFVVVAAVAGLLVGTAFPLLARAARDDHERLAYALQRLFEVSVIVGAGLALLTVMGAPIAIDVIAGSGFHPAVAVLRIQGIAMFASFLLANWGFALISLRRHRALLVANLIALVASLSLVLALAPAHGARGAAWGTIVGEVALATSYLWALVRANSRLRPELGVAAKVAGAVGVASAVALIPGLSGLALVLSAAVAYLAVIVATRAIPQEITDRLPLLRR